MTRVIKLGTRGSKLALQQAGQVRDALQKAHAGLAVEIVVITTTGDWRPDQGETRLSEAQGGKGLFAREIENALLAGTVDIGVHSAKDMPSFLVPGLSLLHFMPRADPRDAFLSRKYPSIDALPPGAVVGTSALRRQAILLHMRPDLQIVPLRGNVPTRIDKLYQGQLDAIILAAAGLHRLQLEAEITAYLSVDQMLPAAGQGIIAIETRVDDKAIQTLLDPINDHASSLCISAERRVLQELDGSCRTPISAFATLNGDTMQLRGLVARPDGTEIWRDETTATVTSVGEAEIVGEKIGKALRASADPAVLAAA